MEGTAYAEALKVHWNTARGKYIWYELMFAANGQLARGSYSATDSATPNPPSPRGLGISLDESAEDNVMRMDLILACTGATNVDSGTDGWTYRYEGNYDGYVQYVRRFDDWADLPVQGEIYQIDVDCTGTLVWRMKWARIELVQELIPIKPPEGKKPRLLYALIVARFTSHDDDGTKGEIVAPDSTIWWP